MKSNTLLLLALFLSINLFAQERSPLAKKILDSQSTHKQEFTFIENVLIPDENFTSSAKTYKNIETANYFNYNKSLYSKFQDNADGAITLLIPYTHDKGSNLILDLIEVPKSFYDFKITTSSGGKMSGLDLGGVHYRGIVRGKELNSLVALSVFENEIAGIVSISGSGTINIGKLGKENKHIIYNDANLKSNEDDELCETGEGGEENPILDDLYSDVMNDDTSDSADKCMKMYFEIDHDIYNHFSSSITNTTNFVTGIFNEVATIFMNESITMEISEIFIWDTPDTYPESTGAGLSQFVSFRGNFNGDLAHLLTFRSGNTNPNSTFNAGGRANNFGGVCVSGSNNLSPHSYTTLFPSFVSYPVFSRQVKVITHEIGHNLGSRHTHACVWNGNDTAIDGCSGGTEGICPLPATIPANTGTIMSYCDRNRGIDFTLGFGPQPGNLIRAFVSSLACVQNCNPNTSCSLSINPPAINLSENAATSSFSVSSNGSWTASANVSWITLNTLSGTGNGTVGFSINSNVQQSTRTGTISIICNGITSNVTVVQSGAPNAPSCAQNDSLALVALYNSADGPNWSGAWNLNVPVSSWSGVGLNANGCVSSLNLQFKQLSGNIPPELGNLSELTNLNMRSNQLTGSLPSTLGNLSKLTSLNLFSNQISGSIPVELGNLSNLVSIHLYNNQLSGNLPAELGNLSNLAFLNLHNNQLTGTIPSSFGNLSSLLYLRLYNNQMVGCYSQNLQNICAQLNSTSNDISNGNNFTASWSNFCNSGTGQCTTATGCSYTDSLTLVTLYNTTNGANWTNSWNLNQSMNNWYGVGLNAEGCVNYLNLNNNNLSGSIPSDLGNLSKLNSLQLRRNQLTGSIPSALGNLSNLTFLNLFDNQLSGSIPSQLGNLSNLTFLNLSTNQLSGSIPSSLGNLSNLTTLYLTSNQLTGSIPSSLGNLSNLTSMYLPSNQLSGGIPPQLGNLSNLTILNLYNNQLSGSIPSSLGNLSSLVNLHISSNLLTGNIPGNLSNLTSLTSIRLDNNQLTGSIPPDFGNMVSLNELRIYNNQLSGCYEQNLTNLCNQLSSANISSGNNFNASWVDFCNSGTGQCTTGTGCRFTDSLALVSLYNSADGPNWNNSWNLNEPIQNWNGVGLNNDGCVISINLSGVGLNGSIPAALGSISNLTIINFRLNQLNGSIPAALGNLSNLTTLNLYGNQLSGSIPAALGNLSNLISMHLYNNQLTGSIPPELGNLTNMYFLNLNDNQLTGNIPPELGNITNLNYLRLYNNQLSGTLPAELGNLTNLDYLLLYSNQLSGCFDQNLSNLCNQLNSANINNGNNFDASWQDFCNSGAGACTDFVTVTDFPYQEGFENGLGLWTQNTDDDMEWTRKTGSTPSSFTGPSTASEGSFYMYTEASGHSNEVAILTSPRFDLTQIQNPTMYFKYHMYGSNMGTLVIEISTDNGASWNYMAGVNPGQGIDSWITLSLASNLNTYTSNIVQLRLRGTTGNSFRSDIAVDDINIYSSTNSDVAICPEILSIHDELLVGSQFQALELVSTNGVVLTGNDVTITSGKNIDLMAGFQVDSGAVFHAVIGDCQ